MFKKQNLIIALLKDVFYQYHIKQRKDKEKNEYIKMNMFVFRNRGQSHLVVV